MAIMRKGPGGPGKVASKMTKTSTSKLKNVFTNISNKIKAEKAGRDQLKKYEESLKQKKLAEQKAQKDLQLKERGERKGKMSVSKEVKVKGKQKEKGGGMSVFPSKKYNTMTTAELKKLPAMDSTTFMNKVEGGRVFRGNKGTYEWNPKAEASKLLKSQAKKNPGARFTDFRYDPRTGSYSYRMTKKGK